MKLLQVIPLALVAQGFVIPDERILADLVPEIKEHGASAYNSFIDSWKHVGNSAISRLRELKDDTEEYFERPRHPHPHKPNETIYQMIQRSKYTTKLAEIINSDKELIKVLNSTDTNITYFAPIDSAFDKIPKWVPKPTKEQIRDAVLYQTVPGLYPAGRVLKSKTLPTLLEVDTLSKKKVPQRLAVGLDIRRGFGLNYYAHLRAVNIFGTNGVVHAVDHVLHPPPNALDSIEFSVIEYTTLNLAIEKTGLGPMINDTEAHYGGTIFAPSEPAWKKLGPGANRFLFSPPGLKYLKALLLYHIVPNITLYTDALYDSEKGEVVTNPHNGYYHFDLKTLFKDKELAVDVIKYGAYTEIKINAFSRVVIPNGISRDGVVHDVSNILIPPKNQHGASKADYWLGEEISVEELKERLDPYVDVGSQTNFEL